MRLPYVLVMVTALFTPLMACTADATPDVATETPMFGPGAPSTSRDGTPAKGTVTQAPAPGNQAPAPGSAPPPQPGKAPPANGTPPPATVDSSTATHPEVVYVLMLGKDGWTWFCTGTLVSPTTVVTAAHCLQSSLFVSWEVVAPTLAARPRVKATSVTMYDDNWYDVAHADLGIVKLQSPINLPAYAQLTDVSTQVDSGQPTSVGAILRTAEQPEAPFMKTSAMQLSSTVSFGYTHGFGLPMFSKGGDSGAGLFLVEAGQMTHKLVGVEREPEPTRNLDHLSRVEPAFVKWVQSKM